MNTAIGQPLTGLRIIEGGSFVAVPSAGMALAQLGADVIRVDPPHGGSDFHRWPLAPSGGSLFWAGLNKGKRSVEIDYRKPEGRELLLALAAAPGPNGGIFLDNMVGKARLTFDELQARRADVIHVRVQGRNNGGPAVDYTINAEVGVPAMTGPQDGGPVNHVLPAWDLVAGMTAATSILAAVLHRTTTGQSAQIDLALEDIALAGVGNMGWLAEAEVAGTARPRHGNHMYGAFGVDFETADHERVMVVALTSGQWRALRDATGTGPVFAAFESVLSIDLDTEADRYRMRETIAAVLRPWFAQRNFTAVREALDRGRVLWSRYRDMVATAKEARNDPKSIAAEIVQPGIGPTLATGRPVRWDGHGSGPVPAPRLGEHTEAVLTDVLGLSAVEIDRLKGNRIIGAGSMLTTE
jgi:2-methylfumaryl-CoA isomerase